MLVIRADLVEQMVAQARRDHPQETCGQLAGPEGSDRPERVVAMVNAAASETFYEFDSAEYLRVHREMEVADEECVAIYHSHTMTEAYPSRTDIAHASWNPDPHYVLISLHAPDATDWALRSYRIADGEVTEEEVQVVENYMFAHTGADDVPDTER